MHIFKNLIDLCKNQFIVNLENRRCSRKFKFFIELYRKKKLI